MNESTKTPLFIIVIAILGLVGFIYWQTTQLTLPIINTNELGWELFENTNPISSKEEAFKEFLNLYERYKGGITLVPSVENIEYKNITPTNGDIVEAWAYHDIAIDSKGNIYYHLKIL